MAAVLLAAVLLAAPALAARSHEKDAEYGVKAAFLYNFTKFVDWPESAFPERRFNLCILGDDPFGSVLDQIVANDAVEGKPIAVQRGTRLADLQGCHIVFFGRLERERRREALATLSGAAVLTVGDADGFLAEGGMVNFFLEANKVRFEVNRAAVDKSPLKMSSKLLRVARVVP
jgi:hypothetical protein